MPFCKNNLDRMSRRWRTWVVAFLLCLPGLCSPAWAGSIEATSARLTLNEEAYVLSAEFNVDLGPHLEEIVTRGVPLYFQLELEITRNRWFWPGEHIAGRTLTYRLAYVPLSRQYRLSSASGLSQDFAKLADALRVMGRTAALPVAERSALKPGEPYQAALRLSLDRQQLPKPLQLDAIANKDWTVDAKILRWQFVAGSAGDRENR
ncbi:putative proline rich signal peptide protein [Sterolibacterium denitrificans]|uniref:Proline rich signal peptide protein n=2 Tax=Sterolibacterium denitrificans TaxID=157592 RepID=A0A7Z7HNJ9_9PROT|nr:DUF4390 domain-containing protein [Sterolibacterium denitrificans]SMB21175.1 putative proline rich signal peptide protein [Sterolibacterium denitrificans]